jgi:hypothetical protein
MTSDTSNNPYVSEYPSNCNINSEIRKLIAHYYEQVDMQGKHVEYSECWAEDGVLVVPNGKEVRGRDGAFPQCRVGTRGANILKRSETCTMACGMECRSVCTAPKRSSLLATIQPKW